MTMEGNQYIMGRMQACRMQLVTEFSTASLIIEAYWTRVRNRNGKFAEFRTETNLGLDSFLVPCTEHQYFIVKKNLFSDLALLEFNCNVIHGYMEDISN